MHMSLSARAAGECCKVQGARLAPKIMPAQHLPWLYACPTFFAGVEKAPNITGPFQMLWLSAASSLSQQKPRWQRTRLTCQS